jgi:hypothetical protein
VISDLHARLSIDSTIYVCFVITMAIIVFVILDLWRRVEDFSIMNNILAVGDTLRRSNKL